VVEVVLYLSLVTVLPVNPVRYQKKSCRTSILPCSPIDRVSVYVPLIGVDDEPKSIVEPEGTCSELICVQFILCCPAIYLSLFSNK